VRRPAAPENFYAADFLMFLYSNQSCCAAPETG
jgi:hypothetical protein